jgi:GT2 family glycosyltransferase
MTADDAITDQLDGASPTAGDAPELSVLVVSWNTRDLLRQCIQSLISSTRSAAEIIVVDNGSSDGTAAMVAEEFGGVPSVRLVANTTNVGFAAANNQALRVASGSVIAVVNPDTRFEASVLDELAAFVRHHPEVGVATCKLVGADGAPQAIHRAFPTLPVVFFVDTTPGRWLDRRLLNRRVYRRSRLLDRTWAGTVTIDQAAGALLVMRRGVIDVVGGLFDERLPLYFNDVDLSRRVHSAHLDVMACYDYEVVHHGGGSLNQLSREEQRERYWHGLEQYFRLHESHWRRFVLAAFTPLRARR